MNPKPQTLDTRADRLTYLFIIVYVSLSWIVLSTSKQLEARRDGDAMNWVLPWVTEFASHFALVIAALVIPFCLTRWPLSLENWKRRLPVYTVCFLAFSTIHILLMVAVRHVTFPFFVGSGYGFDLMNPYVWIYELRKDFMTFILVFACFLTNRHIAQLQLEAEGAKSEARETGRLTLKSGGRTIFLGAADVVWAKSASNYVEVHTETGDHLIRMTLSGLQSLLAEAGNAHIRTHRSYLVKKAAIREVIPTGEGDAKAVLTHDISVPVSRKYRAGLAA